MGNQPMSYFDRLAPFLQDYIYKNHWQELREIQAAACGAVFDTKENLLLSSGTASGKTEAAFLPVLTQLYHCPPPAVGVLYIAPLKALINDQYERLSDMLAECEREIFVTRWHGDVASQEKRRLLLRPGGILQITPESLEAMLMRGSHEVLKLLYGLSFVVIDEVHSLMGTERGIQLLCILERIAKIIGVVPRRIGLSATLGDYRLAEEWLCKGSRRGCITPVCRAPKRTVRLSVAHFYVEGDKKGGPDAEGAGAYYEYLHQISTGRKCILFSNAKAELEQSIAYLKRIAKEKKDQTKYLVHHANVSASSRRYIERTMREYAGGVVTGATVTLELGIDLGDLSRIVQIGAPMSVSAFVQRLGRSGRRNNISEMWFAFQESPVKERTSFLRDINWEFLMCIAVIRLYLEDRWIEPVAAPALPYGILFHQTMSFLMSQGAASYKQLLECVLALSPFEKIPEEDYRLLLRQMLSDSYLEYTKETGFMPGERGEYEASQHDFYAVFENPKEYAVRAGGREVGTIQKLLPLGARFSLGGEAWRVVSVEKNAGVLHVERAPGIAEGSWQSEGSFAVHTRVMEKIREILMENKEYPYLQEGAKARLLEIRKCFRQAAAPDYPTVIRYGYGCFFVLVWLGTRELMTLSYALEHFGLSNKPYFAKAVPVALLVEGDYTKEEVEKALCRAASEPVSADTLPVPFRAECSGKFRRAVPEALRKKEYLSDFVAVDSMQKSLKIFTD